MRGRRITKRRDRHAMSQCQYDKNKISYKANAEGRFGNEKFYFYF